MFRNRVPGWTVLGVALALALSVGGSSASQKSDATAKGRAAKPAGQKAEAEDALRSELEGKNPQEKIQYLTDIVDSGKATRETFFHLGNAKYETNDLPGATLAFQQAVSMDSTFFKAVVNLGLMYDTAQNYPKAIETFEHAGRIEPKNPDVWSHMGNTYYAQGNFPKAMELYQQALQYDLKASHALYSIGVAFADAGIFREAVSYWRRVVEVDPESELGKNASENIDLLQRYLIP